MSLPALLIEKVRGKTIAFLVPWRKHCVAKKGEDQEKKRLEGENHLLRVEIGKLKALLEQQSAVENYLKDLKDGAPPRHAEILSLLERQTGSIPARVIYRDPANWTSSFWVNVGEETNRTVGHLVVAKNSPVLLGRSVVGAIDYVGKKQSRVRLITDLGLKPAVRAVRGYPQNVLLVEHIEVLNRALSTRSDLPVPPNEFVKYVETLKSYLSQNLEGWYLAKGILQGAGTPLWRKRGHCLKGVGFNYDFADEEGPARDLHSGEPLDSFSPLPAMPILKPNDLLVTTGMDGIFPPGLQVAEVTKVFPLREGGYTYDLEAIPTIGNMDELQTVFIIPPVGYSPEDQP